MSETGDGNAGPDVDAVVVGGGVVGASVAYHLSRREGVSVRLFEREKTLGSATTGKSSLGFRQYGSDATQLRMKRYGKRLYNEFMAAGASDIRYRPTEVVHLATTDAGREEVRDRQAGEHRLSSPSERLSGEEVRGTLMLPDVRAENVTAALYRPNAGFFLTPEALLDAFVDRATAAGADVATGTEVTDVVTREGRVAGVVADGETHGADAVVAAAGPWNNEVAAMVDLDLPVRQQPLHLLELDPGRDLSRPVPKVRHVETGVTFRGRPNGQVLAYRAEPAADPYAAATDCDPDLATGVPESVKETVLDAAEAVMPVLAEADILYEDVAFPSRTPDGHPVVGWTERPGFLVAVLHSHGIQYAPAVGDIVARQVADGDPTEHYPDVSVSRFDGHTDSRA